MSTTFKFSPAREPGVLDLQFPVEGKCSRGMRMCAISVVHGAPKAPAHGWDGNEQAPTVTPSIDCSPRGCRFHGFITAGKVTP